MPFAQSDLLVIMLEFLVKLSKITNAIKSNLTDFVISTT